MKFCVDDRDCSLDTASEVEVNQNHVDNVLLNVDGNNKPVYVIFCQPEDVERVNTMKPDSDDSIQSNEDESTVTPVENDSLTSKLKHGSLAFTSYAESEKALKDLGWPGICKIIPVYHSGDCDRFLSQKLKSFGPYFAVYVDSADIDPAKLAEVDVEFRPGVFATAQEAERVARKLRNFGARFAKFSNYLNALAFVQFGDGNSQGHPTDLGVPDEAPLLFDAPSRGDLVKLRVAIEKDQVDEVNRIINENPLTLISCKSGDSPTLLHEGMRFNAMHIAARSGAIQCCELIMEAVSGHLLLKSIYPDDSVAMTRERRRLVTAAYVNMPDKTSLRSPLHWAAKKGHTEVARVLCSEPLCNRNLTDKSGETALHIACTEGQVEFVKLMCSFSDVNREIRNLEEKTALDLVKELKGVKLRDQLKSILGGSLVYIPLYRDIELLEAKVEPPTTENPVNSATDLSTISPPTPPIIDETGRNSPPLFVPHDSEIRSRSLNDTGFDNSPRSLLEMHPQAFPSTSPYKAPGFSSSQPRNKLFLAAVVGPCSVAEGEAIFRAWTDRSRTAMSIKRSDPNKGMELLGRSLAKDYKVPWIEYWSFLNESLDLRSPAGLDAFENHLASRRKDLTPGGKILSIKRFLHYNSSPYSPIFGLKAKSRLVGNRRLRGDVRPGSGFSRRLAAGNGFDLGDGGSNFNSLPPTGKKLVGISINGDTIHGINSPPHPIINCVPRFEPDKSGPGNEPSIDEADGDEMFYDAIDQTSGDGEYDHGGNHESIPVDLNDSIDSQGSSEGSKLANETSLTLRLDGDEVDQRTSGDAGDGNKVIANMEQDPLELEENTSFDTPPDSPTNVPFILGNAPTKLDMDVLAALDGLQIDPLKYPKVCGWLQSVRFYAAEDRKKWPGIDSPRFPDYVERRKESD